MFVDLCVGASNMPVCKVLWALFKDTGMKHDIIWMLRLPRVVTASIVGFGLGLAGSIFQVVLRNPLASPFTLGIGSAAGFGAVCAIIFLGGSNNIFQITIGAFLCSLMSAFLMIAIAKIKQASAETMILSGIALTFLFSSLTSLLQYMGTMEQVHEIVFWFFGNLSRPGWREIACASLMIFFPFPMFLKYAWNFNVLVHGDETAKTLGVEPEKLRINSIIAASLITAGSICFTGVIGFIGLVAPHITRMIIGSDHQFLIPSSGLIGAMILVIADILSRTLFSPQIIPIGIVTSFIGVPFFLFLLLKKTREYW